MSYTGFMTDRLEKHPDWKISLEIEPETWDTVKVRTPEDYRRFAEMTKTDRIEFTNPAYAQAYFYNVSGESIIRHMYYGMKKSAAISRGRNLRPMPSKNRALQAVFHRFLGSSAMRGRLSNVLTHAGGGYTSAFGGEWSIGQVLTAHQYLQFRGTDAKIWSRGLSGRQCLMTTVLNISMPAGKRDSEIRWACAIRMQAGLSARG